MRLFIEQTNGNEKRERETLSSWNDYKTKRTYQILFKKKKLFIYTERILAHTCFLCPPSLPQLVTEHTIFTRCLHRQFTSCSDYLKMHCVVWSTY